MSRCDYDTIFQRVSCVTLIAIAVTFTIILTNVFVAIDGLLTRRVTAKSHDMPEPVLESEQKMMRMESSANLIRPEHYKEQRIFDDDTEGVYRNSPNYLYQAKNPTMKSILTDRLASLLEELDEEETNPENASKEIKIEEKKDTQQEEERRKVKGREDTETQKNLESVLEAIKANAFIKKPGTSKHETRTDEDMVHLAMHNILLQGIIGHMDLNEVFRKVHLLIKNFKAEETASKESEKQNSNKQEQIDIQKEVKDHFTKTGHHHDPSLDESKLFNELTKCDNLKSEIAEVNSKGDIEKSGPKLLIKTVIDITSNKNSNPRELINSKENIKGIIKLIYNGKPIKFSRMEDEEQPTVKKNKDKSTEPFLQNTKEIREKLDDIDIVDPSDIMLSKTDRAQKKTYFNQIIDTYMKKYPQKLVDLYEAPDSDKNPDVKRLKRQVKIRYKDDATVSTTSKPKGKDDDDELYVEIETHFDSKGMKGMKKKKLIRSIVDKIQKAIHSDLDTLNSNKKKKHRHLQVKKRYQNPLDKNKNLFLNKIMIPMENIIKRHSDPISKSSPLDKITTKSGETWKKAYYGPGFLTASKSMNSAEMGQVDVDYSKIMAVNGIPQRMQKPLNTDASDETSDAKPYFDFGNLKFFIKNIDGTGLSIGFNQYTDEAPDAETMKVFTGIENLIQTFGNNDGQKQTESPSQTDTQSNPDEMPRELSERDIEQRDDNHVIIRRSVEETRENDYHSNEYKVIFDSNYLPYDSYQEIFEDNTKKVALKMKKRKHTGNINDKSDPKYNNENAENNIEFLTKKPELIEANIFYKKLKPAEILSLATLLNRKKRSMTVKKIKNINSKQIKINKYINTNARGRKRIILNKKRNKRQIDKIRIIARDSANKKRRSPENIFLIDDENVLADRAIIREISHPSEVDENVEEKIPEDHYDMVPYYDDQPYVTNVFDGRSRHNTLMSKYPHIFLQEVGRSREETDPIYVNKYEEPTKPVLIDDNDYPFVQKNLENQTDMLVRRPKLEELVTALKPKQNFKLTVRVIPKNESNIHSGFKEIHTSINKSFNKDGLLYSSLLNVSEISKITKLNNKTDLQFQPLIPAQTAFVKHIQDQQNKVDMLLKQHKKRIDDQLDNLKKERLDLDTLTLKTVQDNTSDSKSAETSDNYKQDLLNINNNDVAKLLTSALFKLQSQNQVTTTEQTYPPTTSKDTTSAGTTTVTTTRRPTTITASTTTTSAPTTTTHTTTRTPDTIKLKLLNRIQKNEIVTNEILHQINKNTEMLQKFLLTLSEKLTKEREPQKKEKDVEVHSQDTQAGNEDIRRKYDEIESPKFWKPFPPIPDTEIGGNPYQNNLERPKNDTQFAIPFVYAYQPYPITNYKQNIPVASVVYRGHIHAKSMKHSKIRDPNMNRPSRHQVREIEKEGINQTRYFIDDMETEYKIMPASKKNDVNMTIPALI